ncbi:hypothetical protein NUW54_g7448 [Trametes sanguinea]|uniref:Uncharacterized protein n=1 Tax=Trametes sanguinea TaxID=158606 RepID=A0ACC1PNT4_9APHY|nr:hypothetical protein NUW54_g7448 [Trametes sanguinea]
MLLSGLAALIDENHAHLVSLGVSHPALESIRSITSASPYRLSTKLTGAGGGGCAVTLIPDDFADEALQSLISALESQGYRPYVTAVGGSGLGILSPYDPITIDESDDTPPLSPPMTPQPNAEAEPLRPSIRRRFETVDVSELSKWASDRGKWLYV